MQLNGEQLIHASRPDVWAAINDPDILTRCIPGCEEVVAVSDTERTARVAIKIGPVRARFSGRLTMSDIDAPASCRMGFEGAGGAAGFAKGESEVTLAEEGGHTRLRYTVSASVGGKLGQIGGRLIDASAKKLADEFFTALDSMLAPEPADAQAQDHDRQPAQAASPGPDRAATAKPAGAPATKAPASGSGTPPLFPAGWPGEFARLLWFCMGVGATCLGAYFLR